MIRFYHKSLKERSVKSLDKYKRGVWVYIESPNSDELQEITNQFDLDAGHIADALDTDEVPRLEREGEQMYIFTRYPFTDSDFQVNTSTLLFILHPDCLITIAQHPLPRLDKLIGGKILIDTAQKAKLMLQILQQNDEMFEYYTSNINKQIKSIRTKLRHEEVKNKDFVDFVLIEDELNEFLGSLAPMNTMLRRLLLGKHIKLQDEDRELLEDLMLNNEQTIEAAKSNIKSITNIREAYSTIMSNNLNQVIRILTVATVVLSVPTLVASIYGMNVDLPFARSPLAFGGVVVGSLMISVLMLWYFRFKRWL